MVTYFDPFIICIPSEMLFADPASIFVVDFAALINPESTSCCAFSPTNPTPMVVILPSVPEKAGSFLEDLILFRQRNTTMMTVTKEEAAKVSTKARPET